MLTSAILAYYLIATPVLFLVLFGIRTMSEDHVK